MARFRQALAAGLVALALGGCSGSVSVGGKNLNTDKLEKSIAAEVGKSVTGKVDVTCPKDVKIKKDDTFECTVTADDGSTRQAKVNQTDDEGNVHFELV